MLFNGGESQCQLGLEATYGAGGTPTLKLPFIKANVNEAPVFNTSKALVGGRVAPPGRRGMSLVKGSLETEINPDILPTLAWLATGAEAAPAAVVGHTGAYDHVFTPAGVSVALPSFFLVIDKGVDVFLYTGLKINSIKIGVSTTDAMTWVIEFTGQQELLTGSLAALSLSTKAAFTYAGFSAKTGTAGEAADTATDYVETIDISYDNKLDTDRYRAGGTSYTAEIDKNNLEVSFAVKADLTEDTNTLREDFGKTGDTIAVQAAYATEEEIASSTAYYGFIFDILYGQIPPFDLDIPDSGRLHVAFNVEAKNGSAGTVAITVRDGNNAKVVV